MKMRHIWMLLVCELLLLPSIADAAPYDPALRMTWQTLSPARQTLFDLLYNAVDAMETEVELPPGTAHDDVQAVMDVLHTDAPELISLGTSHNTGYYQNEPDVAVNVSLRYDSSREENARARQQLEETAAAMVAETKGSGWDRALALHDALCDAVTYDLEAPNAYNAYGALVEGRAACEGYAEAYALLCRMAGIPCAVVIGQADDDQWRVSHAWNLLVLDGTACYVDVTWDDQDGMGRTLHWYFGLTEEQMSRDHTSEDGFPRPECDDPSANWHVRKGTACGAGDTEEILCKMFQRELSALVTEGKPIDLRMADDEQFHLVQNSITVWIEQFNASKTMEEGFYGAYAVAASPAQRCFLMDLGDR